jgi:hypothetical protein
LVCEAGCDKVTADRPLKGALTLSDYPGDVVRLACDRCGRRGAISALDPHDLVRPGDSLAGRSRELGELPEGSGLLGAMRGALPGPSGAESQMRLMKAPKRGAGSLLGPGLSVCFLIAC